jgi:CheY-like chemotaxis protein
MATNKILLADDDDILLATFSALLQEHGFHVTRASNVPEALRLIVAESFDVLLTDLHMPGAGDGLTVVSAMRHANPRAVTILLSSFPEMRSATQAILRQTDQILLKPIDIVSLVEAIEQRLAVGVSSSYAVESVATVLEASYQRTIDAWLSRVEKDQMLMAIPLERRERSAYLPQLLEDLVCRLRTFRVLASTEMESMAAHEHGVLRRKQGYSAPMMIEEARLLQISVFETLQANLVKLDLSTVLDGVMVIADEVDSQLRQSMEGYLIERSSMAAKKSA